MTLCASYDSFETFAQGSHDVHTSFVSSQLSLEMVAVYRIFVALCRSRKLIVM